MQNNAKMVPNRAHVCLQFAICTKLFFFFLGYTDRDLDIDLSVKLFGSEFVFLNLNENVAKYTPEVLSDKVSKYFEKGLDEAKSFDVCIHQNQYATQKTKHNTYNFRNHSAPTYFLSTLSWDTQPP